MDKSFNFKKYIPNILSLSRIPFSILIPILYIMGYVFPAIICLIIACITDLLDGKLARYWNVESKFGAHADAVGDKIFVGGMLLLYGVKYSNIVFLLLFGEIVIGVVNIFSQYIKHRDIKSTYIGKVKTFAIMTNLVFGFIAVFMKFKILYTITNIVTIPIFFIQIITLSKYINMATKSEKINSSNIINNNL